MLRVDPSTWFDSADFAALLQGTPDAQGNYGWVVGSSFNQALLVGIKQTSGVYAFQLLPRSISALGLTAPAQRAES